MTTKKLNAKSRVPLDGIAMCVYINGAEERGVLLDVEQVFPCSKAKNMTSDTCPENHGLIVVAKPVDGNISVSDRVRINTASGKIVSDTIFRMENYKAPVETSPKGKRVAINLPTITPSILRS
ncbi:hypothetical protein C0584_04235 [Candidatus Parcubacteria bacterium]|nr:MAG: hypothetical protein C0584_04235 [Candidatus Parcubacteria bacterium]